MKVHLIKKDSVEEYVLFHASGRNAFAEWLAKLKFADWLAPEDIQSLFPAADLLGGGTSRVVFNIGGNNYRMICKYWFGATRVHLYIKWIGTHAAYDRLCKQNGQYTIDNYKL